MSLHERIERLWWQRTTPPAPLVWASRAYQAISRRHLAARAKRSVLPPAPLISVGNITVGGSGKTPFVLWLGAELNQRGFSPVILCRGDGGRLRQPRLVQPDDDPGEVGDEALLMAQASGLPVVAGRDRVSGARLAAGCGDVIVLDDGFQYRQLARDCDIVLVPAEGVGNGHLLPAGPLREPVSALGRADLIVRTGKGPATPLGDGREWRWQPHPGQPEQISGPKTPPPDHALAVCGIARPERFTTTLETQGIHVSQTLSFPDHHRYTPKDVERMLAFRLPVIVTGKDAVKLRRLWPENVPLWVLPLRSEGEQGLPDVIVATMLSRRRGSSRPTPDDGVRDAG